MISLQTSPFLTNNQLNELFASAWPQHTERNFEQILSKSLAYVAAFDQSKLVGFVNIAWDGGIHGFILDTSVHADYQRRGIGLMLLKETAKIAKHHKLEWLHVDYEAEYESFYKRAGYEPTLAGLLRI